MSGTHKFEMNRIPEFNDRILQGVPGGRLRVVGRVFNQYNRYLAIVECCEAEVRSRGVNVVIDDELPRHFVVGTLPDEPNPCMS
jgi:hypothetical protein